MLIYSISKAWRLRVEFLRFSISIFLRSWPAIYKYSHSVSVCPWLMVQSPSSGTAPDPLNVFHDMFEIGILVHGVVVEYKRYRRLLVG